MLIIAPARESVLPPNRISQIIRGKRNITVDTALRPGEFFGAGSEVWINLQRDYDLDEVKGKSWPEIQKIRSWRPESGSRK